MKIHIIIFLLSFSLFTFSCGPDGDFNIFTIKDDVQLGIYSSIHMIWGYCNINLIRLSPEQKELWKNASQCLIKKQFFE